MMLPTTIERPASPTRITDKTWASGAVRGQADPAQCCQANRLGTGRQEGRNRGAGALISIRRPGMQRHRRNLESKPTGHQPYGHQEEQVTPRAMPGESRGNGVQTL